MAAPGSPFPTPILPPTPPRKQWYDRLADAVLGEEPSAAAGDMSKYALVCEKCFAWNGLVDAKRWGDTRASSPQLHPAPPATDVWNAQKTSVCYPYRVQVSQVRPLQRGPQRTVGDRQEILPGAERTLHAVAAQSRVERGSAGACPVVIERLKRMNWESGRCCCQ